jgi:hypothetical protein
MFYYKLEKLKQKKINFYRTEIFASYLLLSRIEPNRSEFACRLRA